MSFLRNAVPESCRDAFVKDVGSGVLSGMYSAVIGTFLMYVARKELHCSDMMLGMISAAPFIGCILALFYAHAMEGRPKMPYMVWAHSLGRALYFGILFINTPLPFALVATAAQVIVSLGGPPYAAVINEIYPVQQRGILMSYVRVAAYFSMLVFTLIAGRLLHVVGFHYVFPMAAVVGVGAALVFGTIKTAPIDIDDPANHRPPLGNFIKETMSILIRDRANRLYAIGISVSGFGCLILAPVFTVFQVDKLHMTEYQLAAITISGIFTWAVTYPIWGKLIDKRSPVTASILSALLWTVYPLSYVFATKWWHVLPANIIAGISLGGMELGYFNSILEYSEEGKETQHQAMYSFIQGVRGMIGPFVGAWLLIVCTRFSFPKEYLFVLAVAMIFVGCAILRLCSDPRNDSR
ncbi:MAG TPA: MFS transporter [Armatimonadota bacterium]|jgi:MFS family permease